MTGMYADRARAESFGSVADAYDRFRPGYPAALIDDLAALRPAAVLDVGCGTGKAAVPLAARGCSVLGVEADPRMAEVARGHGLAVEVATFEDWNQRGRTFDLITSGQAWHWIDPQIGVGKARRLLRPGGTLAVFWNYDEIGTDVHAELLCAYQRHAPELAESVVVGGSLQSREPHADRLRDSGLFAAVDSRVYSWTAVRTADEWVQMTATHSDHLALEPDRWAGLLGALHDAIEASGGTVTSVYGTYTVLARIGL